MARRHAFLEAARAVFFEQGFANASVNEVVNRAGGSLATLYSQFGNKEGLFLAVFEDQYARFTRDISPSDYAHLPLEQGLQAMGEQFLKATLSPDHLAFYRLAIGGARSHPELLQRYLVTGLSRLRDAVVAYMTEAKTVDGRKIADPESTATFFFDLMRSRHHYRALTSDSYVLTPEQVTAHIRHSVTFMLHGALRA
ncbi:MAG: TetR/AcrR family transcriptional regulator [Terricaulis sp.]